MPPIQLFPPKFNQEQELNNLLDNLERQMQRYYGENMNSPRIQEFLAWFNEKKTMLAEQFQQDLKDGKIKGKIETEQAFKSIVSFWLGVQYAAFTGSKFVQSNPIPTIPVMGMYEANKYGSIHGGFDTISKELFFTSTDSLKKSALSELDTLENEFSIVLIWFNMGLHEGAHALGYMFKKTDKMLSEFATAYLTLSNGLPILQEDLGLKALGLASGVRSLPINSKLLGSIRNSDHYYWNEYLEYLFAPWVFKHIGNKIDVFQFEATSLDEQISRKPIIPRSLARLYHYFLGMRKKGAKVSESIDYLTRTFFKDSNVDDPVLMQKMKLVFTWIYSYMSIKKDYMSKEDFREFLSKLVEQLNKTFGEPENLNIPKGYANFDMHLRPVKIT
ncbi:hypothetical protein HY570_01145 [Candidatus Micrarchaeota archaeon]|nr:hypothetical protein [Candidatus Micrarchaeota archaeon]